MFILVLIRSRQIGTIVLLLLTLSMNPSYSADIFSLSSQCPSSFEKLSNGSCELRSLYEFYNSPPGFGGLRTRLPEHQGGYNPEQIDLGRYLFFDPILSGDGTHSCARGHQPEKGFSDGLAQSTGAKGHLLERSSPGLWNVGFLKSLFWDGRVKTLEEQALGPLFNEHEMNNTEEKLISSLTDIQAYRRMFAEAFPGLEKISVSEVARALAAFQSSLVSLNSRYDRYAHGDQSALTEQEQIGHTVFRSFVTRCSQCHTPPLFTNQQLAVTGAPELEGKEFDPGAEEIVGYAQYRGAFKVPSLRNIQLTSPYMHSGGLQDLQAVISFYNDERGHAVRSEDLQLHWHMVNPRLSRQEEMALIAFLQSLNDESSKPEIPDVLPSGLPVTTSERAVTAQNFNKGN